MIYYVRGDGGMPVVTVSELQRWLRGHDDEPGEHVLHDLTDELHAIEQQARR